MNIGAFNQIANAEDACSSGSTLIWVLPGDALTAGHQAESIRRLADTLGMTIVREYEDEEHGSGPGSRPQFHRMMDEALSESRPFGAIITYERWRFAGGRGKAGEVRPGTPGRRGRAALRVGQAAKERRKGPGPGVPAEEGGLRAQGDRRQLTLLQHMAANLAQLQN